LGNSTSGASEARSSLLSQIHTGLKLKKAEERKVADKAAPPEESACIDVAAILQRRMAIEGFSDSDSEEGGDSDFDNWSD